jgi:magnesium transporter
VFGQVLLVVGSLVDLVSFTFAPVSLLAPLAAMTLLINLFMAPCFVGETPTRRDVIITGVIFSGAVITVRDCLAVLLVIVLTLSSHHFCQHDH